MNNVELNQQNKQIVWNFWQALAQSDVNTITTTAQAIMADDVVWHGFDPLNQLQGVDGFVNGFWSPLLHAFPDLQRHCHIFMGGQSNGRIDGDLSQDGKMWVSGTGLFTGTFTHDYLTIPANGRSVNIRWGEFYCLENSKITTIYCLLDLIDLMQQAGYHVLPPARGQDGLYPPPAANDGLLHQTQDESTTTYSLDHIRRFIFDGLNAFDQSDLKSMGMADYFHPNVHWYGPGGIGACLSFQEFEEFHQKPWLIAYPDRRVQNLDALIAEGNYSGAPGWAGVKATHTGPYLNHTATDKLIEFNGLDWWKRDGEMYIENWVFVDMVHLFRQFGIDLFSRLAQQIKQ